MSDVGAEHTVLVVEDDQSVQEYMQFVLEDAGYNVALANNGSEALHYLQHHAAPSLILLDIMMPIMDGYAFRAAQQNDPVLAAIPVVVLSASVNVEEQARRMRVAGYLAKPMLPEALLAVVARYRTDR